MNIKFKRAAVVTSVIMALSGCLEDGFSYNDGKDGTGPVPGGEVNQIYGEGSNGAFIMQAVDKGGMTVDVDGQENTALSNIQVIGGYLSQASLNVSVTQDAKAGIQFIASSPVDYSKATVNKAGVLLFDVHMKDFPSGKVTPATVTLKSDDGSEGKVDITSSLSAYLGVKNSDVVNSTQSVRIPLQCFADQGVDFSKVTQSFSMDMSANANFDISNVRVQAEAGGDKPGMNLVIECDNSKSEVLTTPESIVYARQKNDQGEFVESGWTYHLTSNGAKIYPVKNEDSEIGWAGVESTAEPGKQTYLSFILNKEDVKLKDVSQYLEKGTLEFTLWVESYSEMAHPTNNIMVKIDTPTKNDPESPSPDYRYPASKLWVMSCKMDNCEGAIQKFSIPLSEFFSTTDGDIDINILKHIKKVVFFPEKVDDKSYSPKGFKFSISDLKFVMNP
ncbi:putative glycoside hydrolase [Photobacterium satsumensis]|uniref:putative glycoside hydrolase n=1 Tax=Photobacterium satsumensis TaxID=2910239 RepID=UPI003D0A8212